jgi:hypothetical protein
MSALGENIRQAIISITKNVLMSSNIRPSKLCKVIGVSAENGDNMSCDVESLDTGSLIEDVRLTADNNFYGFVLVPTVGSMVEVSFNTDTDAFLSMVSQVDKVYLNGNDYGGLVEVANLVTKLNNLENKVNDLVLYSQTHTHSGVTVGSGITGTGTPPVTGNLTPTQRTNIENTTVQHGQGNLM